MGGLAKDPVHGEHLRFCPRDYTCCSSHMEDTLAQHSQQHFLSAVRDSSHFLFSSFSHTHRRFDELFRKLIDVSEESMSEMFTHTYGRRYTQNAHIITQLFTDLRRYYTGGRVSLAEVLDDFWAGLLECVFSLLNPQYELSDDYLECVRKHSEQLLPFGDRPLKLHTQVSRAFTAARALVQALAAGREIVSKATQLRAGPECVRALMRQWFCPLCRGLPSLKPCHSLCLNIMKGCLANQADLNSEWNSFIDALTVVVEKLGGPFNFELAADAIAVTVSEGIMNMQENSISISAKVFQGCGIPRPVPGRNKRSAAERDAKPKFRSFRTEEKPSSGSGTDLDQLVQELQARLKPMRGFWLALPHTICSDEHTAADVTNEEQCWNGQTRGRYLPAVTADGLLNQLNNPELELDVSRPDTRTRQLMMELRAAIHTLRLAQHGRDTHFTDGELEPGSGSGGGASERFSDDWPGYTSFSSPRNTPVDKPLRPHGRPRPNDWLRPQDTPTNKKKIWLNGRSQSDALRPSPALPLMFCFTLCLCL
ncbi:glypican-2 isoform X1 [Danio rerio]|uniref:Glypican-2 isoform X1 n=2 Tax=Danio rerio TaxID=7955 RepID=A0AC58H678_DANRE